MCGRQFKRKQGLDFHVLLVHEGKKPKRPYGCSTCKATFTIALKLKNHCEIVHEGKKSFSCTICKDTFTTSLERSKLIVLPPLKF